MSFMLNCPCCGRRNVSDFTFGGECFVFEKDVVSLGVERSSKIDFSSFKGTAHELRGLCVVFSCFPQLKVAWVAIIESCDGNFGIVDGG